MTDDRLAADDRPTIHMIGLHHTAPSARFNHCAFTGKQIRFPKVAAMAGYRVVEYANFEGRTSTDLDFEVSEHHQRVEIFGSDHLDSAFDDPDAVATNFGDRDHRAYWETRMSRELGKRVRPGDVIAHIMPPEGRALIDNYPDQIHVETGIGYEADCAGTYRIFESETWRAWHQGRYGHGVDFPYYRRLTLSAVVPNFYDPTDWRPTTKPYNPGNVLFVGRMNSAKGIEIYNRLAESFPDFAFDVISGEPRSDRLTAPNIVWIGRVDDRSDLARYYQSARCVIVSSRYQEPFGGVCAEALLSGCPVVASCFGAMVEHVQEGDGMLAGSADEFVEALKVVLDQPVETLEDRQARADRAAARWGYAAIAPMYRAAIESFRRAFAAGIRPV